jgi:hypothetical protein
MRSRKEVQKEEWKIGRYKGRKDRKVGQEGRKVGRTGR